MTKTNIKNNYSTVLNVAGVDIRPGATAAVETKVYEVWKKGNAAKIWLEQKLIEVAGKAPEAQSDRELLEARAKKAGVYIPEGTTDAELQAAVEAAEGAQTSERDKLMAEATELGLNPNKNTGVDKLKKMIADKRG